MLAWFAANKLKVIIGLIAAVAVILLLVGVYYAGHSAGKAKCEAAQAKTQVKAQDTRARKDAKIDKNIPVNAGRAVKLQWLQRYTVGK